MDTGLFESLPDALIIVDAHGRIVRTNAHADTLFGFPPGALIGQAIEALMPESSRARHREHRINYAASPRMRPMGAGGMVLVGRRHDGEEFPVEIALSPLAVDAGQARFLASIRDVSETLRARQALARARYDGLIAQLGQEALETRSMEWLVDRLPARLAATLGSDVDVGLCLRDASGRAEWVATSGAVARTVDPELVLRALEQTEAADVEAAILRARPRSRACAVASLGERGHASGMLVAWSMMGTRFDHDAQHLLHSAATLVVAFLQRKRAEEQLAHAQRLDALGQLTGGIAHDFNNLMTVLSGCLQLLAAEPGMPPPSTTLIESALRAVRRGTELTDKLLSFARRKQLRPTTIDATRLLEDIVLLLERTLGDGVRLEASIAPGVPPMYADAAHLDAALVNLALNARDAMPGGGTIAFSVEARTVPPDDAPTDQAPGQYVVFVVADSGTGMSADVASRAIEPFFSTKAGRGSGLGLSMVYGFVQQSGGGMSIRSTPGTGTRIELFLPVAADPAGVGLKDNATIVDTNIETVEDIAHPGKALVVEDDDAVRAVATAFMRSLGYSVIAAADYEAALACLDASEGTFDVVFSDLMLGPGPDGIALAQAIRTRWPRIGIVITSGHAQVLDAHRVPGTEMLAKPYDRDQLAAAVARSRARAARNPPRAA